ncbi:hypothetical protein OV450_5729 [Actinobacteria bacterium OV450]|nr:hypothetical protein OV450_5729 [Actinobacteria bacterium OV450]
MGVRGGAVLPPLLTHPPGRHPPGRRLPGQGTRQPTVSGGRRGRRPDDHRPRRRGPTGQHGTAARSGTASARETDRDTYTRTYGHRGPHEFEVSLPRPAEDARWIDRQLAALGPVEEHAAPRLARQTTARAAAWERLAAEHPRRAAGIGARWTPGRPRHACGRPPGPVFWLLRTLVLRAGELRGAEEHLFFLYQDLLGPGTGTGTSDGEAPPPVVRPPASVVPLSALLPSDARTRGAVALFGALPAAPPSDKLP